MLQEKLIRHPFGDQLATCVCEHSDHEPLLILALVQSLEYDLVDHHDDLPKEHPGHE
jgi:hypothetical protein